LLSSNFKSSPATHVRVGEHDITTTSDGAITGFNIFNYCLLIDFKKKIFSEDIPIKKYTTHESYSTSTLQNDIAIIELEKAVTFRVGLRPACLPDKFKEFDLKTLHKEPVIVGWGSTTTGGTTVSA